MGYFITIVYLGLGYFLGHLIHTHSQSTVPFYVKLVVFISWMLSIGMVLILPYDIYTSKYYNKPS